MDSKILKLQKWIKEQKEDRRDRALALLGEGETGRKRYVYKGELDAYAAVEDQIERILIAPDES